MKKISIITAVAYAYAAIAAASFALGFLLAPAKAQAGEGEIIIGQTLQHCHSSQKQPDRITTGAGDQGAQLQPLTGPARVGSGFDGGPG